MKKESFVVTKKEINKKLGAWDILVNDAGGNHLLSTASNSFLGIENKKDGFKAFFDL